MKIQIKILDKEFYSHDYSKPNNAIWYQGDYVTDTSKLPNYATPGSAAIDLVCTEDYTIYPGERVMIGTGLAIWIGSGDETNLGLAKENGWGIAAHIIPRSGLGTRGLVLANLQGLIDADYQGELKVSAWNSNNKPDESEVMVYDYPARMIKNPENSIILKPGDRIAQMYFAPVIKCDWDIVEDFIENTERGYGGFGSTGS